MICGNWGNTHLRAFGLNSEGVKVTEVRTGPGVLQVPIDQQKQVWLELTADWTKSSPDASHLLCGAVGSNIGWLPAGYVECPTSLHKIGSRIRRVSVDGVDIGVVPGLATSTPLGEPDRLRGEETELLGWLSQTDQTDAIVCIPGTHCKWLCVANGTVQTFVTGFVGELFELLKTHSILIGDAMQSDDRQAFQSGLDLARSSSGDLTHLLFSVRARQLSGELSPSGASDFLSGLIIGADVRGALDLLDVHGKSISIVASTALAEAYKTALRSYSIEADTLSSLEATVLGFSALQAQGI